MLAKGLAMIAKDDKQSVSVQPAASQPLKKNSQSLIPVMQRVAVMPDFAALREGAAFGTVVGMVPRDGQVGDKEFAVTWHGIDPRKYPLDSGWFIHAKAGVEVPANRARILH